MIILLTACAVVGFGLIAFGARLGRNAFVVGALPLAAAAGWAMWQLGTVTSGPAPTPGMRPLRLVGDTRAA